MLSKKRGIVKSKHTFIDSYNRSVYGKYELESVLIDLIKSPVIQRLRNIQQHGPDVWVWKHANITRFEHSIGVMLLLKKFGAPLQEQVAGLLHDSSHGAFSHAIDFVYGNQLAADFADRLVTEVIGKSNMPLILKKYGFTLEEMFRMELYPLLERPAPDLCADRIDYFFRDSHRYGVTSLDEIRTMLDSLTIANKEFVFSDPWAAFMFGSKYLEAAGRVFGSKESIFFHTMIAEAIKIALRTGILSSDDLFLLNDLEVSKVLIASQNPEIKDRLSLISPKTQLQLEEENPDVHLKVKVRLVDPKVIVGKNLKRLSEINNGYANMLEHSRVSQGNGYKVKIRRVS